MNAEWKPGRVAKLPTGVIAVADDDGNLVYGRGKYENARRGSINAVHASPLVVIDPDDAEQVERLCDLLYGGHGGSVTVKVQSALRELAGPTPRIKEPTERYAVVADCDAYEFIRLGDGPRPWMGNGSPSSRETTYAWSELAHLDLTVISPGVPS